MFHSEDTHTEERGHGPEATGEEQVLDNRPALVNVPPDGLCFYHCVVACRNLPAWVSSHGEDGLGSTTEIQHADSRDADTMRDKLSDFIRSGGEVFSCIQFFLFFRFFVGLCMFFHGCAAAADRLLLTVAEDDFEHAADILGGRLLLQCGPCM